MQEKKIGCEKCDWTGQKIIHYPDGHITACDCECTIRRINHNRLVNAGIEEAFTTCNFENYNDMNNQQLFNAKQSSMEYVKNFQDTIRTRNNSILFSGQVGSGKTHLGIAICSELMKLNMDIVYMPYRNAVTKIKQCVNKDDAYGPELRKYTEAGVLYIDDLLKGKITDADVNVLYEIVNYRYLNNKPMIISTEKTLNELLAFDEAIGSRIIEMSRGHVITFKGKNLNYRLYGGTQGNLYAVG